MEGRRDEKRNEREEKDARRTVEVEHRLTFSTTVCQINETSI